MGYLNNLQQQPKHIRNRFSLWTSAGLTALIAIIWFGGAGFVAPSSGERLAAKQDAAAAESPIAIISDGIRESSIIIKNGLAAVGQSLGEITN